MAFKLSRQKPTRPYTFATDYRIFANRIQIDGKKPTQHADYERLRFNSGGRVGPSNGTQEQIYGRTGVSSLRAIKEEGPYRKNAQKCISLILLDWERDVFGALCRLIAMWVGLVLVSVW